MAFRLPLHQDLDDSVRQTAREELAGAVRLLRDDYHDDPVEEFFYQLKGDMVLKIVENGKFYEVPIQTL